jgi:hypothetical protein
MTGDLLETFNLMVFGKDYRQHRQAVAILIDSLGSGQETVRGAAHRSLVKITGQIFPPEPGVWRKWWELNEKTFKKKEEAGTAS